MAVVVSRTRRERSMAVLMLMVIRRRLMIAVVRMRRTVRAKRRMIEVMRRNFSRITLLVRMKMSGMILMMRRTRMGSIRVLLTSCCRRCSC
jgi:hypothetical protein